MLRILAVGFILTALLAGRSMADDSNWSGVGGEPNGVFGYGEKDSIQKIEKDIVSMWTLWDIISSTTWTRYGEPYKSWITLMHFDCSKKREVSIGLKLFAGNMGTGRLIYSDSESKEWKPVKARSIGGRLLQMACKSASHGQ